MRSTDFWRLVPGAALILLSVGTSHAMTLGRAQGLAVIGRPLDITVPVVLDAGTDVADLCPRADVHYGDTRIDSRSVDLRPNGSGTALLRVRVPRSVDELFVTVQVQVGCTQTLSRRFVLLSEQPGDIAEAAVQATPVAPILLPAPTALPVQAAPAPLAVPAPAAALTPDPSPVAAQAAAPVAAAPAPRPAAAPRPAPAARPPAAPQAAAAPVARPAAAAAPKPAASATRPVTPAPKPAPKAATVERPRLKLDAADLGTPPAGSLKPSDSLQGGAAADAGQRAEAAARWQALTTQPDDLLRSAERMATMEGEMRAMREGLLKNQALMAQLSARLEQSERERYSNGLVYALAGLLAAASGLAALFWRRSRQAQAAQARWWAESSTASSEPQLHEDPAVRLAPVPARAEPVALAALGEALAASAPQAFEPAPVVAEAPASAPDESIDHAEALGHARPFQPTGTEGLRVSEKAASVEELADVQQQADFFMSLGEYQRAVAVLREYIDAHPQASVVAWLELQDIYHRLQRESDYEQLRRDFEWLFNQPMPAYADYQPDAAGLEAHAEALERLQSLWGRPEVIGFIEDALMRQPHDESQPLGAAALRELLMLHGVAIELVEQGDMQPMIELPAMVSASASPVRESAVDAANASLDVGALDFLPLSLDPVPADDWRKLAAPNSRPAGLDLNLDDLDRPPAAPAATAADTAAPKALPTDHLLDFDLDLDQNFKLPKR
ncbi:hypothetical protein [Ramlibacter rhizophilus]|uniref:Tetratricopeptide repeat protein n=1 Tax=Ramlibacter rhizophilus TaxID=1781167 RepID=A0A4Z0BZN6_9BURK|nr:hypothetical protein [Ramlibacter rhizophilus]TFZ04756.1 hypothetical protein EZ242_03125 [Ramlibacter rhizophilus]